MLASNCNNIILKNNNNNNKKEDAVYNAFAHENPFIFMVTRTVAKRKLKGERSRWITKRRGDCVEIEIFFRKQQSNNGYNSIYI